MSKSFKSALNVKSGIEQPSSINPTAISKLKSSHSHVLSANDYFDGITHRNRTILSKAITLVESSLPKHQELAEEIITLCLKEANGNRQQAIDSDQSPVTIRIGITGVPGAGKSSFIEILGRELTSTGHKVAVLAIDPSSTRTKGSILGDKTRMEELSVDPNAFIRPSPSAGSLGGVARKTRETIILCEAAGFDVIFIETVGVGQSEVAVHSMVDFFLLLMLAGAGDELQGIKRGILEMADAVIINKADGDNIGRAKIAKGQLTEALHYYPPPESGWKPVVDLTSCKTKEGIPQVWDMITKYRSFALESGYFFRNRMQQNRQVMFETVEEALKAKFYSRKDILQMMKQLEKDIASQKINPYLAAKKLIGKYFDKEG